MLPRRPEVRSDGAAAARLLRRGESLEDLACPSEALVLYEGALALPEAARTPVDTGRLLHRIGCCALETGDHGRAVSSLLAAGRLGRELGLVGPCAESLSTAGAILAACPPATSIVGAVDEDVAWAGFHGVLEEARETLLGTGAPNLADALGVHARFASLTVLSSYAYLEKAPLTAATFLSHDVLLPFMDRHDLHQGREEVDDALAIACLVQALARLCAAVGEQGRQHRSSVPPTRTEVASMARSVAEGFPGEAREEMRRWLGSYLREYRGANWATGEHLLAAADDG